MPISSPSLADLTPLFPVVLILCAGGFLGTTFPLAKLGSQVGLSPLGYALMITFGAGGLLTICATMRRVPVALSLLHLRYSLISGLFTLALPKRRACEQGPILAGVDRKFLTRNRGSPSARARA